MNVTIRHSFIIFKIENWPLARLEKNIKYIQIYMKNDFNILNIYEALENVCVEQWHKVY